MGNVEIERQKRSPQPLPANIKSVQPGGGYCYQIEVAWGYLRRWYLKRFRPGYVQRMAGLKRGGYRRSTARDSRPARSEIHAQSVYG